MKTSTLNKLAANLPAEDRHTRTSTGRIEAGSRIGPRELESISGARVRLPDNHQLVHLQFRRFAGCPVCNLHLRSFARRHKEIANAGVREIVLFHSTAEELREHASDLPFVIVADPQKTLYREFGVEASVRSLLDPRAWPAIASGVLRSLREVLQKRMPSPSLNPGGGRFGLPADFLIASDGTVVACKRGVYVYDQWSVDELLQLVHHTDVVSK